MGLYEPSIPKAVSFLMGLYEPEWTILFLHFSLRNSLMNFGITSVFIRRWHYDVGLLERSLYADFEIIRWS